MAQMEPLNPFRSVVDLNGDWERYIHGKLFDRVVRPFFPASFRDIPSAGVLFFFLVSAADKEQSSILTPSRITEEFS